MKRRDRRWWITFAVFIVIMVYLRYCSTLADGGAL